FTIFYMGINIGAFLSPLACQWVSQAMGEPGHPNYRYGFLVAGAGMLLGLVCFGAGGKLLGGRGGPPSGREGYGTLGKGAVGAASVAPLVYLLLGRGDLTGGILIGLGSLMAVYILWIAARSERQVRERLLVLLAMLFCSVVFWMCFEQAGNSLNF